MLKFTKFLSTLQNLLLITLLLLISFMFYIRYKMYNITNNLSYLDRKIEKLQSVKQLLTIELTYLTSTERILALMEKNPKILNEKEIINILQFRTKKELINISLAKAMDRAYKNKNIAKNKTINDIIESEL